MIEQAVTRFKDDRYRRWTRLLRALQLLALAALVLGEVLGMTLAGVYFDTDQALFWQWVLQLILFGAPLLLFAFLLELRLRLRSVQFDYCLQGSAFTVYRLIYSRRKPFLSFDLASVRQLRPFPDTVNDAEQKRLLKDAVVACCNADAALVLVTVENCLTRRGMRRATVVLEPDAELLRELKWQCRDVVSG